MTATLYLIDDENVYDCGSKPFALISYNPTSRNGALEEALDLQSGLESLQCQVFSQKWDTKLELSTAIRQGIQSASGCLLLVVCLMSHGRAGVLMCSDDNNRIALNDVMFEFNRKLESNVPLVS